MSPGIPLEALPPPLVTVVLRRGRQGETRQVESLRGAVGGGPLAFEAQALHHGPAPAFQGTLHELATLPGRERPEHLPELAGLYPGLLRLPLLLVGDQQGAELGGPGPAVGDHDAVDLLHLPRREVDRGAALRWGGRAHQGADEDGGIDLLSGKAQEGGQSVQLFTAQRLPTPLVARDQLVAAQALGLRELTLSPAALLARRDPRRGLRRQPVLPRHSPCLRDEEGFHSL